MSDNSKPQTQLDTRGLEIATEARTLIQSHIRECESTREQMLRKFEELKKSNVDLADSVSGSVRQLYTILWQATGGLIIVLVACVGYFLIHDGLPGVRAAEQPPPAIHR